MTIYFVNDNFILNDFKNNFYIFATIENKFKKKYFDINKICKKER